MRIIDLFTQKSALLAASAFIAVILSGSQFPAQAKNSSYFNAATTRSHNLTPFSKWTSMRSRFGEQEKTPDDECGRARYHPCVIKEWKQLLQGMKGASLREQIERINNWANDHPYIVDQLNWGMEDFWATPFEFMEMSGDCEDYAIAKYYSLRALGVSAEKLRVIIVQDFNLGGIIHAILGVYDGSDLLILDNQIKQVIPALRIYHYRPIYSLNESDWWLYQQRK